MKNTSLALIRETFPVGPLQCNCTPGVVVMKLRTDTLIRSLQQGFSPSAGLSIWTFVNVDK